jgi:hypothetical protein
MEYIWTDSEEGYWKLTDFHLYSILKPAYTSEFRFWVLFKAVLWGLNNQDSQLIE